MYGTPDLVSAQALGVIEIINHENVPKTHACLPVKCISDAYLGRSLNVSITSFSNVDAHIPEHQKVGEVANALVKIAHI